MDWQSLRGNLRKLFLIAIAALTLGSVSSVSANTNDNYKNKQKEHRQERRDLRQEHRKERREHRKEKRQHRQERREHRRDLRKDRREDRREHRKERRENRYRMAATMEAPNVSVTGQTSNSVTLEISAPTLPNKTASVGIQITNADTGQTITKYYNVRTDSTGKANITVSGLNPGTKYTFSAKIRNGNTYSNMSGTVSTSTTQ